MVLKDIFVHTIFMHAYTAGYQIIFPDEKSLIVK